MRERRSLIAQIFWFFFSFEGRVSRFQWWWLQASKLVIGTLCYYTATPNESGDGSGSLFYAYGILLFLVLLSLAADVKRWHDRNKSGWWNLVVFIPYVGPLWQFFELGFLPGSEDENRYGLPPDAEVDQLPF